MASETAGAGDFGTHLPPNQFMINPGTVAVQVHGLQPSLALVGHTFGQNVPAVNNESIPENSRPGFSSLRTCSIQQVLKHAHGACSATRIKDKLTTCCTGWLGNGRKSSAS